MAQFAFDARGMSSTEMIDSARYAQQRNGFVAAVALKIAPHIVGVNGVKGKGADLSLYPNPSADLLTIEVAGKASTGKYLYSIVDLTGKVVYTTTRSVNGRTDKLTVNTGGMANGTYILMVTGDDGNTSLEKFVVSH